MPFTRISLTHRLLGLIISTTFTLAAHAADTPARAIQLLDAPRGVTRTISLEDLGISAPLTLQGSNAHQEFYFPVPTDMLLTNASLVFDAHYLRSNGGRTTLLLSVNGAPVNAQNVDDDRGDTHLTTSIDQHTADSGFIRVSANWSSSTTENQCSTNSATGNALMIDPSTRLSYRYNPLAATSLDSAWAALPGAPVILVSGRQLDRSAYDTAWRIGVALERTGKRTTIRALPIIGDTIDTRDLTVPSGLATVPAFAALTRDSTHKIASLAELGALIVLGSPAVNGDLAVMDQALQSRLAEALDAVAQQLTTADAQAGDAFSTWRTLRGQLADRNFAAEQIALSVLGNRSVIAVVSGAGTQAAGIFNDTWRHILTTRSVRVKTATAPVLGSETTIPLSMLGGSTNSFDVVTRGDWVATFAMSAAAISGKMPNELVLYLAAAPGASTTKPVASVFLNDVLLAAKQLNADGKPERLTARVPGYALSVSNALRVSFQRQPVSVDCNEVPQGYPVTVLPSSHMTLGTAEPDGTFVGLLPLLAGTPDIIIPQSYLDDSPASLPSVIRLAIATGFSPERATLQVIQDGQPATPSRPFLAMDVRLVGASPKAVVEQPDQLKINGQSAPWLDAGDLGRLAVAEVARSGKQDGVLWHSLGDALLTRTKPYVLNRGDIAILGEQGPVAWIDSSNPAASHPPGAGESAFFEFRRYVSWGVPVASVLLLLFIILLVLAYRIGRKRQRPGDST